jgi:GntR family transcriptional regulator/MocR family aminotransferase
MWSIDRDERGLGASAIFARLAAAVTGDIRRGVLRAGDRLPSTRDVAAQLGVNRNTVVAAYEELVAQGWVESRGAGGTFVAAELPERRPRHARPHEDVTGVALRPAYDLAQVPGLRSPQVGNARFLLSAGIPDPRIFPRAALARAYRRVLQSRRGVSALEYAEPGGMPALRDAIAMMLRSTRSIPATGDNVLVTRGSQMAIELVARALVRPGAVVAVEHLGYQPAWRAFEAAGATLEGITLDAQGLVVDSFPACPRCVYTTPHHQYPTTTLLAPGRRLALLERARRERFAILEDDYDHEFHFDGRPVPPLASSDRAGSVIYVGTLSKTLAPGLRLGFVAAPAPVIAALTALRSTIDRQGDHALELAVADLITDGEAQRHTNKARRIYASRRDALASALRRELGDALAFELPAGGITLWARVADDIDLERWQTRALAQGVAFSAARDFALDRRGRPFVRLAFARYSESELATAVRIMARTLS